MPRAAARRGDTIAVALAAALPSLLALACFGPVFTPDTPGYLDLAAQIAARSR